MLTLSAKALLSNGSAQAQRTLLVVGSGHEWVSRSRTALGGHPELSVLGVVDSGREALSLVPNLQPDIVLVDAETHDLNGFEVLRHLRRMARTGRVILSGPSDGLHWRYQAQAAGAAGYLPRKHVDAERVLALV
jgi:DNA-binding NarL/FixJ family response regulator